MGKDIITIGAELFKDILSKQQPWKRQKEKGAHHAMCVTNINIYA